MRLFSLVPLLALAACSANHDGRPDSADGATQDDDSVGSDTDMDLDDDADDDGGTPTLVQAQLVAQGVVTGVVRVSFAVPLARGQLSDASRVRVRLGSTEIPAVSRGLARWLDGSWRSVQVQVDHDLAQGLTLDIDVGQARTTTDLTLVAATTTLTTVSQGGETLEVPRVWVVLPAPWLAQSGVFGPLIAEADEPAAPLNAWSTLCDYDQWNTAAFFSAGAATTREVWLYDRGSTLYRGYARRGDLATLQSAYKETALYLSRITLSGGTASIALPQSGGGDAKYIYAQNLAYHYLLTGDDRFREAAEAMAARASGLFDPVYNHGSFWTERNAGFTLLANVFAAIVSDDKRNALLDEARTRVSAYLAMQSAYAESAANVTANARCFGHDKVAADENDSYPATFVCSPWMSAILADGLEAFTHEVGESEAAPVRESIVALGRRLARPDNQDGDGRPYYILGVDGLGVPDDFDEHWGETAYVIALAYHVGGRTEEALRTAALDVAQGFASFGEVAHVRSFNWQCRSAVATPALLAP